MLLETAARLQDVGYLIDYDRHHKHSYHLILNSRLQGFQPHELELIANIARYHRGSRPKKKHANFMQLSPGDRRRVEQLAAILRLAGGLDRSHSQQVTGVTIHLANGDAKLQVHSAEFPDVDLWGTRRRASLFESVFDASLSIDWVNSPAAAPRPATLAGEVTNIPLPSELLSAGEAPVPDSAADSSGPANEP
jgi:exopolyphosphatase/guanosine-5'-triphosphate,3'-diphosphate pyrophosphatase